MIPNKIWIAGIPITIEFIDQKESEKRNPEAEGICLGHADYKEQKIVLVTGLVPEESLEQTYHHEKLHWMLHIMGRVDLRDDEPFVNLLAHFMYQARKYEVEEIVIGADLEEYDMATGKIYPVRK